MINSYEFQKIKRSDLPSIWREEGALDELEKFLQGNWEKRSIFYSDNEVSNRQRFLDFDRKEGFKTQNYIGTITFRGEQLNIFPKIFKEDEDDNDASSLNIHDLVNDLIIWLSYCDKFNFPFVSMKGEMDNTQTFLELLITVYVHYVKVAIDHQLFFRYEETEENGCAPKGKINIKDYATRKYTNCQWHKLQYTYSSFVFDNMLNRIIKCTCKILDGITTQPNNHRIIHDILVKLNNVTDVNSMPYDCDIIHLNALQTNYIIILSMSKVFLLNKVSSQDMGVTETFCFLFPAELLFEGFISGFMRETFSNKVHISTQTRDLYLTELIVNGEKIGNRFQLKEDIVVRLDDAFIIFDTKYKEIERLDKIKQDSNRLGITDADIKQMAIYANRRGAKRMYLLYPLYRSAIPDDTEVVFNVIIGSDNTCVKIPLQILQVPFSFSYDTEKCKKQLLDILGKAVQPS